MRLDRNRPDLLVEMEWFFCPPGAKIFPQPTAFSSRNYTDVKEHADLTLGEVEVTRRWIKGQCPPGVTGQFFCGDPAHAADGCDLVNGPLEPLDPYDGVPLCCRGGIPFGDDDVRDINFWKQAKTPNVNVLYTGGSVTGENPAPAAAEPDVIHALPFFPARGGTLDRLGYWLETVGDAGAKVRCAIYEGTSERNIVPANLIVETVELDADFGPGEWKLDTISVILDRQKLYWICLLANSQAVMPIVGAMTSVFYFNIFGFSATEFRSKFGIKCPFTYGPFPATFPVVNNSVLGDGSFSAAAVRFNT